MRPACQPPPIRDRKLNHDTLAMASVFQQTARAFPPVLRSGKPWRWTSSRHHLLCLEVLQCLSQAGRVDIETGENAECVNALIEIELIAGHDRDTCTARASDKIGFDRRVDSVKRPTLSREHAGRKCVAANVFHAERRAVDEAVGAVAGLLDRCRDVDGKRWKDSSQRAPKLLAFRALEIKQMERLGCQLAQRKRDRLADAAAARHCHNSW